MYFDIQQRNLTAIQATRKIKHKTLNGNTPRAIKIGIKVINRRIY